MKSFDAFLIVALGAGMNAVRAIQKNRSPFSIILGAVVFGAICVAINDLSKARIGTLLAGVFLLSSTLVSGVPMIDSLVAATKSYEKE